MAPLTPLHSDAIRPVSAALAAQLAGRSWAEDVYLAGSAALALYLEHRPVRDLDLMAPANRLGGPERRDLLGDLLDLDPSFQVETARDGFLYVRHGSGVAVRLFHYPYPLVAPLQDLSGLPVASALDLGLMKIGAIISRGTRRDFVDIYLLAQHLPLDQLLESSIDKFGHVRDFPLQALKGLADFSLVEGEPMPRLNQSLDWETVSTWFRDQVRQLGRIAVGLTEDESE